MKIRGKLVVPLLSIVVISILLTIFAVNTSVNNLVEDQEASFLDYAQSVLTAQAEARKNSIYTSMAEQGAKALELTSFFTRHPGVLEAYRLALTGDINNETDPTVQQARQQLRLQMAPFIAGYKELNGVDAFSIHFHLPNARSFARLWRDGWNATRNGQRVDVSDDLSSFRQTVVEINQGDHKPLTGIEVGRGGFALRGLAPISGARGNHLGSCEVLASFNDVLKSNHADNSYQIAVYMIAEHLTTATSLQDPQKNPVLDKKYVFTSSTDPEKTNPVISAAILDAGRTQQSQQIIGDSFISTFPINDYSGKLAGVVALVYDMSAVNSLIAGVEEQNALTLGSLNWRFSGGGTVLLIILAAVIFLVARNIVRPLKMVVDSAQCIALGDLGTSINYTGKDEIADLANAMNSMIESLKNKAREAEQIAGGNLTIDVAVASDKDTMGIAFRSMVSNLNEVLGEVQVAAKQIDAGSHQVSDTAQNLSQGATESAASLEEISSSMNEIGSQSQQSANNAQQASLLAQTAQASARNGSERMAEMITAMNDINSAGQNINKIIKVIDEIAFQTNLLALNAAVEAARAGQHGKGFAVVAEEVRNLAARSAKAASETAELIEGTVEKTVNGTQIAERTSKALEEIVASVLKVNDLVAEIAAAGTEQAQGIAQINIGLGQIDQAVQQSTATAEESAAAAEELSSQSVHLRKMLDRFTLVNGGHNVPAPRLNQPVVKSLPPQPGRGNSPGWGESPAAGKIQLDDNEFGRY